jgi:hypothetical protein
MDAKLLQSFSLAWKQFANLVGEPSQKRRAGFPELVGSQATMA